MRKFLSVVGIACVIGATAVIVQHTFFDAVHRARFAISHTSRIPLTADQTKYVNSNVVIVGFPISIRPLVYEDQGEPKGLSIDYLRLIAKKTGLRLQFKAFASQKETLEAMKAHQIDVASTVVPTDERRQYMDFTHPYVVLSATMLVDSLPIKFPMKIGFGAKYSVESTIERLGEQVVPVPVSNDEISFKLLMDKEVGGIVMDESSADFLEQKYNRKFARVLVDYYYSDSFGFQKGNESLGSILEAGVETITDHEREAIEAANFVKPIRGSIDRAMK